MQPPCGSENGYSRITSSPVPNSLGPDDEMTELSCEYHELQDILPYSLKILDIIVRTWNSPVVHYLMLRGSVPALFKKSLWLI